MARCDELQRKFAEACGQRQNAGAQLDGTRLSDEHQALAEELLEVAAELLTAQGIDFVREEGQLRIIAATNSILGRIAGVAAQRRGTSFIYNPGRNLLSTSAAEFSRIPTRTLWLDLHSIRGGQYNGLLDHELGHDRTEALWSIKGKFSPFHGWAISNDSRPMLGILDGTSYAFKTLSDEAAQYMHQVHRLSAQLRTARSAEESEAIRTEMVDAAQKAAGLAMQQAALAQGMAGAFEVYQLVTERNQTQSETQSAELLAKIVPRVEVLAAQYLNQTVTMETLQQTISQFRVEMGCAEPGRGEVRVVLGNATTAMPMPQLSEGRFPDFGSLQVMAHLRAQTFAGVYEGARQVLTELERRKDHPGENWKAADRSCIAASLAMRRTAARDERQYIALFDQIAAGARLSLAPSAPASTA
jgi:hypothetical protein